MMEFYLISCCCRLLFSLVCNSQILWEYLSDFLTSRAIQLQSTLLMKSGFLAGLLTCVGFRATICWTRKVLCFNLWPFLTVMEGLLEYSVAKGHLSRLLSVVNFIHFVCKTFCLHSLVNQQTSLQNRWRLYPPSSQASCVYDTVTELKINYTSLEILDVECSGAS